VAKRPKGAPGIYELEPGLFKIVVSLGRDGTGRYRQQARTVRGTLREAKALRARVLTDAADGKLVAHTGVTFLLVAVDPAEPPSRVLRLRSWYTGSTYWYDAW